MRFSLRQRPNLSAGRTMSFATRLGDLVCHQMYFAASAIRPPTAMTNTAICNQTLFAKPLVFLICVSIAG
jgi:hypothetical protein